MRLIARHLPDGGWECVVPECRFLREGMQDIQTHLERDHHAETFIPDDGTLDIYDIREPAVFRAMGLI